jgi:hypothetical protein
MISSVLGLDLYLKREAIWNNNHTIGSVSIFNIPSHLLLPISLSETITTSTLQKKLYMSNNNKVSEDERDKIRGELLELCDSMNQVVKKYNCHRELIQNCCDKKSYYQTKNLTFRYENDVFDYVPYKNYRNIGRHMV